MKKYNYNHVFLYLYVFSHAKRPPKLRELNREIKGGVRILIILVIGILLPTVSAAQTMSSENFTVEGGTFGSGGTEQAASSNFLLNFILGEALIGDGTSTNFQLQAGLENVISPPPPPPPPADPPGLGTAFGSGGAAALIPPPPPPPPVPQVPIARTLPICQRADFNGDGVVDLVDFGTLVFFWGVSNPSNPCLDINGDGNVDLVDFGILVFEWTG